MFEGTNDFEIAEEREREREREGEAAIRPIVILSRESRLLKKPEKHQAREMKTSLNMS